MDGIIADLAGDLRPRRPLRRHGHGGRLPRRRLHGRERARHARALRRGGRVDILTGTLGKALGGASGGYTSGRREVIAMAAAALAALPVLQHAGAGDRRRLAEGARPGRGRATSCASRLDANAAHFRRGMAAPASRSPGGHPIVPVMLGDARLAQDFADALLARGIYVIGFFFPVVPRARRASAPRCRRPTARDLDRAVAASPRSGRELGVIREQ